MSFSFYAPIEKNHHGLWSYDSGSRQSLLGNGDGHGSGLNHYRSNNQGGGSCSISEPKQSLFSHSQIQLRFLNPGDYDVVKTLCEEWFPVEYPAKWFEAITSDSNLFSLAAILDGKIVGLIVAELKQGRDLNREDRDVLCEFQLKYTAAYILSLGVVDSSRRQGVASLLLSSLLNHLSTLQCKAVYLHVLTSNEPALHFYEKHRFRVHKFLPYYYSIGGRARDGFTYVLYLNGGHGPWGIQEYVAHFCEVTIREIWSVPRRLFSRIVHSITALIVR
ncbi:N-alpha-acetyltransferase 60 [Folsomia candida]|uniref:N-alpha-acetyltransferase 60 n=1 Tax=Folsomia candida TaxID=158441 RepID=A0A226EFA5_FOLCA|nr:N-alpha-acetyltransferase 60 [Folsomia candida]OXA56060.1 N-alpha-acetyltransferase 60 [Folsomia candida]